MDMVFTLVLGSLKALLLLTVAAGFSLALKGHPARLRAVVWGTALVGSLLIPIASALLPAVPVVVPVEIPALAGDSPALTTANMISRAHVESGTTTSTSTPHATFAEAPSASWTLPDRRTTLMVIWAVIVLALLVRQAVSHWQMVGIIRRATPIVDPEVLDLAEDVRMDVGCRVRIRLISSSELDIPAVFGFLRPVVILPTHYQAWLDDRLTAVLQHELIHVVRFDWPVRITARLACAVYWFNPLAWWAVRRLHIEQEMACDEEVLSLGSRASSYACHLLGIARTAVHHPTLAVAGLEMARRSDLEERIMRILNRSKHRKVGLAVILPAALLTAALVPAIAAVQPTEPGPRPASPELKAALAEMEEAEKRIEPYLERISEHEFELQPVMEKIEAIEIEIDHEAMARIEVEMAPIIARIEAIHFDMEPMHAQLEAMHESLESMELHIEDGTLEQIQDQIHEQMEAHHAEFESVHIDMEPFHDQMEDLHAQLEPLHEQLELLHLETMPSHEEMERFHAEMEPLHEEMERLHEEMEPFHEAMEELGERIEGAIAHDVADVLRSHLGPVTGPGGPFDEAAARIIDEGSLHIDDEIVELHASRTETREILNDLFSSLRIGTQDAFDQALEAAVVDVSNLELSVN